jgi:hypothetical protein
MRKATGYGLRATDGKRAEGCGSWDDRARRVHLLDLPPFER